MSKTPAFNLDAARETFGRAAFALTGARWASEMIGSARMNRRWAAMESAHIAKGGTVVTRKGLGFSSSSLEA